jgi:predicted protein tyrosine phosphatase
MSVPNDRATLTPGWRAVLQLEFHDICEEVVNLPIGSVPALSTTEATLDLEYNSKFYRWPDQNHAQAIRDFVSQHHAADRHLQVIVHCDQGKSRSAAVARYLSEQYRATLLNAEPEWKDRVTMSDTSRANPRLLRLLRNAP